MQIIDRIATNNLIVLAGPILRRAEPSRVCIWIATNIPVHIRTEIFLTKTPKYGGKITIKAEPIGFGIQDSISLGDHLHITLVQAKPISQEGIKKAKENFPSDVILAYDLELFENLSPGLSERGKRLKDLQLLGEPNGINYYNRIELPTFFLRKENPLNILYGSCRKLHGPDEDCLAAADKVISENLELLGRRPSVLFLTGDQIYADDVAGSLIEYLNKFGHALLGSEEKIPSIGYTSSIPVGGRHEFLKKVGFESELKHASNHLLSFGEFSAMYLMAWNVENWPEKLFLRHDPSRTVAEALEQYNNLERARQALPAVRRILANIPTYMIFDDHEITDDWNLTKNWKRKVEENESGRRIIANGLAAYWAFQAWGNEPELFDKDFIETIKDYLSRKKNNSNEFEKKMLGYHDWTFYAPTDPLTIFVDTRTNREYDNSEGAARILNQNGRNLISKATKRANYTTTLKPLLIVSPAPVYGYELIESLQTQLSKIVGPYKYDLEAWRSNLRGFIDFMKFLSFDLGLSNYVILSGDVHYAYSIHASFTCVNHKIFITQLTSSSLKNTAPGNKYFVGGISQLFSNRTDKRLGWDSRPSSQKMEKLSLSLKTGKVHKSDIQQIVDEINYIQSTLSKTLPITLDPELAKDWEIRERPSWEESRTYIETSRVGSFPIVGDNNLGLVKFERGELRLEHQLLIVRKDKTENVIAQIEISPIGSIK